MSITIGFGSQDLAISIGGCVAGDAQFTLDMDGQQAGGVLSTVAARAGADANDQPARRFRARAAHAVGECSNELYDGPGSDRTLYVAGATLNGTAVLGSALPGDRYGSGQSTRPQHIDCQAPTSLETPPCRS